VCSSDLEAKVYCAQGGETLRDIARKTLGSSEEWLLLDRLNPELRSGSIVPAGTIIRLPGRASAAPVGGQAESEASPPMKCSSLKPLPIVRLRKPDAGKIPSPMTGSFECKLDAQHSLTLP